MAQTTSSELTKQYIIEALFLLMESKPYDKISITEITKKAGVSRATYYRHFESKDDIVVQCFKQEMTMYSDTFSFVPASSDIYYERIFTMLAKFKEKKELMKRITRANLTYVYLQFLNDSMVENFKTNRRSEGGYEPYYFAGSLFNISMEWLKRDCQDPVKVVADAFYRCLFGGLDRGNFKQP